MIDKEKIKKIFDNFTKQEFGNRLSEFSILALKEIVLNEIEVGENKGNKKVKE